MVNRASGYDVYVSYCSANSASVHPLANRLEGRGLRVWIDKDRIGDGDPILLKINEGLALSRNVLLCGSKEAYASKWVGAEIAHLLMEDPQSSSGKLIFLDLDPTEPPPTLRANKRINGQTDP